MADYVPIVDQVLLLEPASGSTKECAIIVVVNDTVLEDNEDLSVLLLASDPDVTIRPNIATLLIVDDDGTHNMDMSCNYVHSVISSSIVCEFGAA